MKLGRIRGKSSIGKIEMKWARWSLETIHFSNRYIPNNEEVISEEQKEERNPLRTL